MAKRKAATLSDAATALKTLSETLVILADLKAGKRPIGFEGPIADAEGTFLSQDPDPWDGARKRQKRRRK
jgi:hypothetical protein